MTLVASTFKLLLFMLHTHISAVLGALTILQKAIIILVMSAHLSFRIEQLGYHGTDFH